MESDMGTFTPVALQFAGSDAARMVKLKTLLQSQNYQYLFRLVLLNIHFSIYFLPYMRLLLPKLAIFIVCWAFQFLHCNHSSISSSKILCLTTEIFNFQVDVDVSKLVNNWTMSVWQVLVYDRLSVTSWEELVCVYINRWWKKWSNSWPPLIWLNWKHMQKGQTSHHGWRQESQVSCMNMFVGLVHCN